jgi:hypothetical protein
MRTTLLLIPAKKSRGGEFWPDDDYDVRDDGRRVVGRIFATYKVPRGGLGFRPSSIASP